MDEISTQKQHQRDYIQTRRNAGIPSCLPAKRQKQQQSKVEDSFYELLELLKYLLLSPSALMIHLVCNKATFSTPLPTRVESYLYLIKIFTYRYLRCWKIPFSACLQVSLTGMLFMSLSVQVCALQSCLHQANRIELKSEIRKQIKERENINIWWWFLKVCFGVNC